MEAEFTGQYDSYNKPIYVGDLVVLANPDTRGNDEIIYFEVIKEDERFKIRYHKGPMGDADPAYKQGLNGQVYKVVGHI